MCISVQQELWQRTEVSAPEVGGLRASWRVLRVAAPPAGSGALRVRCEAALPVEPPVRREAALVLTLLSRTQLSKYVSNAGTSDTSSVTHPISILICYEAEDFVCGSTSTRLSSS